MNVTATTPLLPRPPRLSRRGMSMLVVGVVAVAAGSFAAGRATTPGRVAAPAAEVSRLTDQSSASLHAAGIDTAQDAGYVNGLSLHAAGIDTAQDTGYVNGLSLHAAGIDTAQDTGYVNGLSLHAAGIDTTDAQV